jgi:ABC-type multidrug transport system ATPase subunit
VGALIEVAAGFHGDLTGRENIYLQGAIMGMRLKDITRKFDDIVDFSGVTEFIDTPVKRYSSGMSARLGFSIAAHLDPDVLIIDEVLAVGDFLFQERAFGRIKDLARSGIPVVIVSHQLERVADLCTEVIVLERGVGVCRGPADEAIAEYVRRHTAADTGSTQAPPVEFRSVQLVGGDRVPSGGHVTLRVDGVVLQELGERIDPLRIRVRSLARGEVLFVTGAQRLNVHLDGLREFSAEVRLQANLAPGSYLVELCAYDAVSSDNVAFAPSTVIHVTDVGTFRGSVQLNPEMTLVGRA